MKKVIALIMCLVVVLSIAASASASYQPSHVINVTLDNASIYKNTNYAHGYAVKDGKTDWRAPFTGPQANKRVVARVYGHLSGNGDGTGGEVLSATWVYSDRSYNWHPYNAKAAGKYNLHVFLGAKLDNRDNQIVTVSGKFVATPYGDDNN